MPVGMIFDSGQRYSGRAYRDAMVAARLHGVLVVFARRGMHWTSGDGVTLEILAPSMPFLADTGDDVNENSIIVMLHDGAYREIFMGDAGEASESRLRSMDRRRRCSDARLPERRSSSTLLTYYALRTIVSV
jgi:beta-lactamase superfamily II metal-dependent hydrolase